MDSVHDYEGVPEARADAVVRVSYSHGCRIVVLLCDWEAELCCFCEYPSASAIKIELIIYTVALPPFCMPLCIRALPPSQPLPVPPASLPLLVLNTSPTPATSDSIPVHLLPQPCRIPTYTFPTPAIYVLEYWA